MRSNRSSPVAPVADEGAAAMTMAQMAEMMRSLQVTVEASRVEQARMHEDLVASRARNEELSKVTEELRQALQEQQGRSSAEEVAPSSPPRVFPMPFVQAITDTPIPASVVPVKAVFTGVELLREDHGGAPRGYMRKPRWGSSSGRENSPCRLLLAIDERRLQEVCPML